MLLSLRLVCRPIAGVPCLMRLTFQSFCLQTPPAVPGSICFHPGLTICDLGNPGCRDDGILGFAVHKRARHNDRPNRVRYPADRLFTSSCSPPFLSKTQLLSVNRFRSTYTGTYTLLVKRPHRRTCVGLRPLDGGVSGSVAYALRIYLKLRPFGVSFGVVGHAIL